jgi:hypothetical protein
MTQVTIITAIFGGWPISAAIAVSSKEAMGCCSSQFDWSGVSFFDRLWISILIWSDRYIPWYKQNRVLCIVYLLLRRAQLNKYCLKSSGGRYHNDLGKFEVTQTCAHGRLRDPAAEPSAPAPTRPSSLLTDAVIVVS